MIEKVARFLHVVRDDDIRQLLWVDEDGNHLVTSSTSEKGETRLRETMLFNANESGEIFDAEEIARASDIGRHEVVLMKAGYKPDWETQINE